MKRHIQQVGVRKWAGGDFIELQGETLKALDGFFAAYGPCVVQGCGVTDAGGAFDVSKGLVVLQGKDHADKDATMIVPFDGAAGVSLPLYLTLDYTVQERAYGDGKVKPVAYSYYARPSAVAPGAGVAHLAITAGDTPRFVDVIQDENHRFITDTERGVWNGKASQGYVDGELAKMETAAGAQAKADAASAAAKSHADAGDASTLTAAKTYTHGRETAVRTDMVAADTVTLRDAKSYADAAVAALVDGSPEALNTLQELAAALGDDPNFATTVMALIGEKLPSTTFEAFKSKAWTTENFAPNEKFDNLGRGSDTNDNDNRVGAGYSNSALGGNPNGPYIKFGQPNYITELYNVHHQNEFKLRRMMEGTWQAPVNIWHSENFDPSARFGMQTAYVTDLNDTPINTFWVSCLNTANTPVASNFANGFTVVMDNNPQYLKQWCFCKDHTWFRQMHNGNWGAWTQIWDSGNFSPADKADAPRAFYGDTHMNYFQTPGFYTFDGPSVGNTPPISSANWRLLVMGASTRCTQIASPWDADRLYFRRQSDGGAWSAWQELYHSGNLTPATPSSTGLMSASDKAKVDEAPRVVAAGSVSATGQKSVVKGPFEVSHSGNSYVVTHSANTDNYSVLLTPRNNDRIVYLESKSYNSFTVRSTSLAASSFECGFEFVVMKY